MLSEFQRQGIGKKLLMAGMLCASQTDVFRLQLTVSESNAAARSLYDEAGFVREGLQQNCALTNGRLVSKIMMAKTF
ncbi:GNAT family N-acetyltransferase [Yoonia sp. SDW83-1]|uniref:GNAT family N-acetyltransferase n=1 Tax=Yoonia sp. SDW83-1 TaxID=3366945 RepID=UPI00398C3F05